MGTSVNAAVVGEEESRKEQISESGLLRMVAEKRCSAGCGHGSGYFEKLWLQRLVFCEGEEGKSQMGMALESGELAAASSRISPCGPRVHKTELPTTPTSNGVEAVSFLNISWMAMMPNLDCPP